MFAGETDCPEICFTGETDEQRLHTPEGYSWGRTKTPQNKDMFTKQLRW
jgi:hypothetical protein